MATEYSVEAVLSPMSFIACRWVVGDGFNPRTFRRGQGNICARDRDGHPVVLFQNNWGISWTTENNPDFELLQVSPLDVHAGSL